MIEGLDFSNHQRTVDARAAARAGKQFGFCKATEGLTYDDSYFPSNWANLRDAGLYRGAYHYLDGIRGKQEAYYFLSRVVWSLGDIPIVDAEQSPQLMGEELLAWLDVMEMELGTPGLIYTSKGFADSAQLDHFPELARAGLWLALWNSTPGVITADDIPEPWKTQAGALWAFHQWTAVGSCPGIVGPALLDVFNGPLERLPLYGVP